jgi:hypothetical protein
MPGWCHHKELQLLSPRVGCTEVEDLGLDKGFWFLWIKHLEEKVFAQIKSSTAALLTLYTSQ